MSKGSKKLVDPEELALLDVLSRAHNHFEALAKKTNDKAKRKAYSTKAAEALEHVETLVMQMTERAMTAYRELQATRYPKKKPKSKRK